MSTFVDTSALLAVVVDSDLAHAKAAGSWATINQTGERFVTTNYVLLEFLSVLQRRHGLSAVRAALDTVLTVIEVLWVDQETHERAIECLLGANRRDLSIADCTSFAAMRQHGIRRAFTVDPHFAEQGFEVVPPL